MYHNSADPKQIAINLVNRFEPRVERDYRGFPTFYNQKLCACITIETAINQLGEILMCCYDNDDKMYHAEIQFWNKVKEEVEKL